MTRRIGHRARLLASAFKRFLPAFHADTPLGELLRAEHMKFCRRTGVARHLLAHASIGDFVVAARDHVIGHHVYARRDFDSDELPRVMQLVAAESGASLSGTVIVDVGANIGTVSVQAVSKLGFARAVAIEPEPDNLRLLRANIALNDLIPRVDVVAAAAAAQDGAILRLEISDSNSGDNRVTVADSDGAFDERKRSHVDVEARRIDTILDDLGVGIPGLIWMDIQGYEPFALSGASRRLAALPPLCFEFWPYGLDRTGGWAALPSVLSGYTRIYDMFDDRPSAVPISALASLRSSYEGPERYTNLLALR